MKRLKTIYIFLIVLLLSSCTAIDEKEVTLQGCIENESCSKIETLYINDLRNDEVLNSIHTMIQDSGLYRYEQYFHFKFHIDEATGVYVFEFTNIAVPNDFEEMKTAIILYEDVVTLLQESFQEETINVEIKTLNDEENKFLMTLNYQTSKEYTLDITELNNYDSYKEELFYNDYIDYLLSTIKEYDFLIEYMNSENDLFFRLNQTDSIVYISGANLDFNLTQKDIETKYPLYDIKSVNME